jgi:Acetyl-CoA dehydrogenase C-terminal like/Acyl-CoA dehydrogenase, C-terminal domain
VKGVGSERSYELLGSQSLQTLGGSGFLQDYPIEQYIRDAKIDTLYEGTTAIQGMDLFFRKIVRDQGQALGALLEQVKVFAASEAGNGQLKNERGLLETAVSDVEAMVGAMVGDLTASMEELRNIYKVGLNTTRLLLSLGDLVVGWLLLRQAEVALLKLTEGAGDRDTRFYEGKVAAAKFFAQSRLPLLTSERVIVEGANLELMDLDESAF